VSRIGVGYDAVDVPSLSARGIPLFIAGTANSVSVAEQALFFMFHLARNGTAHDRVVREGKWGGKYAHKLFDLYGKTLVIVGFGRIGTRSARRCAAFDMNVLIHDPYVDQATIKAAGYEAVSDLDAVLPRVDIVCIHCPKNPETIGMFNAGRFNRMKKGAFIVNTARGGIIDEKALHAALTSGHIAGAGLDVFDEEPAPVDHPLLKLNTVISSPHMAGVTVEAMAAMSLVTAQNILSVLDGKPNKGNAVNPEVLG